MGKIPADTPPTEQCNIGRGVRIARSEGVFDIGVNPVANRLHPDISWFDSGILTCGEIQ